MSILSNTPIQQTDILIIGGGPAGASAGLALLKRGDLKVCIVEPEAATEHRYVEHLASKARATLEYLEVWDEFKATQALQAATSEVVWGMPALRPLNSMFDTQTAVWPIERQSFEQLLADVFVRRGGQWLAATQVVTCVRHAKRGWMVQLKSAQGETRVVMCKFIIDASGRRGVMRTNLNLGLCVHDRLVGVSSVGSMCPAEAQLEVEHRIEACEYGWWMIAPLPDNRVSVTLMSDPDVINEKHATNPEVWQKLLKQLPVSGAVMSRVVFDEAPRAFPFYSSYLREAGGKDWVAVGDAVACFDPITSVGLARALASGVHGAYLAVDSMFSTGELLPAYSHAIVQEFKQNQQKQWQVYQREARWASAPFWARRRAVLAVSLSAKVSERHFFAPKIDRAPLHLKGNELQDLWTMCTPDRSFKEIVQEFAQHNPQMPEHKILLGLQELVERAFIDLSVDEEEDSVFANTERFMFE